MRVAVAVDLDDTIAATGERFCRRVEREHGTSLSLDQLPARDEIETATLPGTETPLLAAIADAVTDSSFLAALDPLPGAIDALGELAERARIEVVTRRPSSCRSDTLAWLERHGVPFDELACGVTGERAGRAPVLIDDRPEFVRAADGTGRGVLVLRPFNVDALPTPGFVAADATDADPAALATDPARQWDAIREHVLAALADGD